MTEKIRAFIREYGRNILLSILKLAVGIMLLIDAVTLTSVVIRICGAFLLLAGLRNIVRYFRKPAAAAAHTHSFAGGLICLAAGLFCLFDPGWLIAAFPLLAMLYCIGALIGSFVQLQWTADMIRLHRPDWWLQGISALVSLLLAGMIFWNPFAGLEALWLFIALSLIASSAPEIIMIVKRFRRKHTSTPGPAAAE